jgi:hypothetical protein
MIVAANLSGQPDLWSATARCRFVTPYLRERLPVTKRRQPFVISFQ